MWVEGGEAFILFLSHFFLAHERGKEISYILHHFPVGLRREGRFTKIYFMEMKIFLYIFKNFNGVKN